MVSGHLALGLAASGVTERSAARGGRPALPLWACLVAALTPDLVMGAVGLVGTERAAGEYSHALPAMLAWAAVAAALALAAQRPRRDAALLAALVLSHLPADVASSCLEPWPGGPRCAAGLYSRPALDFAVEGALAAAGWAVYRGGLPAGARGRRLAWAPLGVLLALQAVWAYLSSR